MEISMARGFLGRELSFKEAPVLSFELNGDVVAFIPREQEEERSRFRRRIDKAMAKPHGEVSASKWRIAIGTRAWSVSEFNESFNNAFKTKGVTSQLNVTDRVAYFRDWYMHMLLLDQPRKQLEEQMRHELEPILDAADLLETLTNYLVFGENLKVTSEKTYIHVNTLKYRLKRISELLCCDLKDPTVRFRLRMAITMYRFLEKGEA
jgi:sugar diacid utilization regulator